MNNIPQAVFAHAAKRCKERYGVYLEYHEYQTLNDMVTFGIDSEKIHSPLSSNVYEVRFEYDTLGLKVFYVAYNKDKKCISTFLPTAVSLELIKNRIIKRQEI